MQVGNRYLVPCNSKLWEREQTCFISSSDIVSALATALAIAEATATTPAAVVAAVKSAVKPGVASDNSNNSSNISIVSVHVTTRIYALSPAPLSVGPQ